MTLFSASALGLQSLSEAWDEKKSTGDRNQSPNTHQASIPSQQPAPNASIIYMWPGQVDFTGEIQEAENEQGHLSSAKKK